METITAMMEDGDRAKKDCSIAAIRLAVAAATKALPAAKFWVITKNFSTYITIKETLFKASWCCDALVESEVEETIQGLKVWVKDHVRLARKRRPN